MADVHTAVGAFTALDARPNAFLLESVEGGERWGRYSFLGGDSFATVVARDGRVSVSGDVGDSGPEESEPPLAYVSRLLRDLKGPRIAGLPPFAGGAVGYLAYDCVRELERLPHAPPDDLGLPELVLLLTRTMVAFDHLTQRATVLTNVHQGSSKADYDAAVERCEEVIERIASGAPAPVIPAFDAVPEAGVSASVSDEEFRAWVATVKEHVRAGDVFQVVPSRRFDVPMTGSGLGAYRALRVLNPSPYMYLLRLEDPATGRPFEIIGSSPEPLVRVTGDTIVSRPIAGTRGRGRDDREDEALAVELLADPKERAEHVMLVDLARNDVGRVSRYGSVSIDELMTVERYSHVMHLVSNVRGRLRPEVTPFEAMTASFPAGTVSGAPKVRAMEIIDGLERTKRGPYAGVVGYFGFSGDLDTCIAIRTAVAVGGRAYVQAGAGVVADSSPAAEVDETRRKAEGVLQAVASAIRFEGAS